MATKRAAEAVARVWSVRGESPDSEALGATPSTCKEAEEAAVCDAPLGRAAPGAKSTGRKEAEKTASGLIPGRAA